MSLSKLVRSLQTGRPALTSWHGSVGVALLGVALLGGVSWVLSLDAQVQQVIVRIWDEPTADPDRIVITWSGDPTTTQSVTWRTDTSVTAAQAQVAVATAHPGFSLDPVTVSAETQLVDASRALGESVVASFHSVTFTSLAPGTLYAYRVGDGERWSEWFQFRTASAEPEPFSFIYFGDAQNDVMSLWSRVVRASALQAPKARLMIHSGDLVDRAHRNTEWGEWFHAGGFLHAMIPSLPTPGNHEYRRYGTEVDDQDVSRLSQFWRAQFSLPENGPEGVEPETSYFLDFQGVRFISLNSNEDLDAQAEWLDRILSDNDQRWTVITHHHPTFSSGLDRDNEELRAAWKPIYDRHGVDLVLQGHDHTYARGRTDASSGNTATGVNRRDDETGTVYVVSVSGRKMYEFKSERWDDYPASLDRRAENTQLFQVIRVDGGTMSYQAFTAIGELYDAFDLIKQEGRPNRFVERVREGETFTFEATDPYRW